MNTGVENKGTRKLGGAAEHGLVRVCQRFARGMASPGDRRLVLTHLLKGCPECVREIRAVVGFKELE
jgi:hypothetical protein